MTLIPPVVVFLTKCELEKKESTVFYLFCLSLLFYVLYIYSPIRVYDSTSPFSVLCIVMLLMLMFFPKSFQASYLYSRKFLVYICIFSIVSMLLFSFRAPFPNVIEFSSIDNGLIYKLYYFSFYAINQTYSVAGLELFRNSAWFAEPGHFAILLAFFLCMEILYKQAKSNYKVELLLVFSLLTTMSSAGLLGFSIYFISKTLLEVKKNNFTFLYVLIFVFLFVFGLASYGLLDKVFLKFNSLNIIEVLNNRSINPVNMEDIYKTSPILGYGNQAIEIFNFRSSDFRVFIYKFGFFALFLFVFSNIILLIESFKSKNFALGFFFVSLMLIVLLHRSWMIDKPFYIYFMGIYFLLLNKNENN
ncbi:hypothetical protein ACTXIM_16230 [Pseudoalteromonas nigrifaciens]|uniref:hypothetical protein n=1 Tax=Pseudoalteromonas nigrifaciens TaxID=28109 RepID=UPI003FCF113D